MSWFSRFRASTNSNDRRLDEWRRAWAAAVDAPSPVGAHALRSRLVEIGMESDDHEIEREMLEGLDSLVALAGSIAAGPPPVIQTGHRAVGTDPCYFSAPASLPDHPAQPGGTLLLTHAKAIFVGGPKAVTIPWHSVAVCTRQERDLVLVRADREDLYRIRCNTYGDALQAALLARHLSPRRRI